MKVTDIKPFVVDCFRTNWVFVKVYTDEGIDGVEMRELSMGMSGDYDLAAAHGATLVRIGSALLGPRG